MQRRFQSPTQSSPKIPKAAAAQTQLRTGHPLKAQKNRRADQSSFNLNRVNTRIESKLKPAMVIHLLTNGLRFVRFRAERINLRLRSEIDVRFDERHSGSDALF